MNPETIYTAYTISYTEDDESVHCSASFRFGGNKGTTLVLNKPSKIELDGENIQVDSSRFSGAYYQLDKPFPAFAGAHYWSFTNTNGSVLKEDFIFRPFTLTSPLPPIIHKKDLTLKFKGLDDGNKIDISVSDTSSKTDNIGRSFIVQNNQIIINATELSQLKNGPLEISIDRYTAHPLQQSTKEGGQISMHYALKTRKTTLVN